MTLVSYLYDGLLLSFICIFQLPDLYLDFFGCVSVLIDVPSLVCLCAGTISFFMDGMRFGEHVLADLGVAYEKLKETSFNNKVNVVLYPAVGFKRRGDKVTLSLLM